jgi:hypothetical protein
MARDPQPASEFSFAESKELSEDEQGRNVRPQRARVIEIYIQARMAELVDAQDSKSCDRKVMRVRFSLRAPSQSSSFATFGCSGFDSVRINFERERSKFILTTSE